MDKLTIKSKIQGYGEIDFPENVKVLSPKAYEAYVQTIEARERELDLLVGAGLRISLEYLVWDYLTIIKGFSKVELEPLNLKKRIDKMNCDFYSGVCTKLIRLFGNDSVHIIKMLDFSIDEVIDVVDIFFTLIDNEITIIEANKRLNKKYKS